MGMFDTIRSSIDLGPSFWHRELQTKDLECSMMTYWIDPAGQLFEIDYSGTQDFELNGAIGWDAVPNGSHGKVKPVYITRTIEVYPSKWDCHYAAFPRMNITFIDGVLRK